jgi:hypothetical protein
MLVWLGLAPLVAALVYLAAPHHQRLIGDRPTVNVNANWD